MRSTRRTVPARWGVADVRRVLVVGGGIFGITAALALRQRGNAVSLVDPGPIPHPLAESTDISKVVRLDYGDDELYTQMMEGALDGWRRWNETWGEPLFHESGVTFLTKAPMAPGGFEHDSHALLSRRGHVLERLDARAIARRFPAWKDGSFVDGYFHAVGGWVESGRAVARLADQSVAAGVTLLPNVAVTGLLEEGGRVAGVVTQAGARLLADVVVVAAGAWTPDLVPWLAGDFSSVGQPVFHLAPEDPSQFASSLFPVFCADIARTGWYGFPLHGGVVKVANHGKGRAMHPSSASRTVNADEEAALRLFLAETFPGLVGARIAGTRICVYGDTADQHFWIAPDPERSGLVVAAGGSGHGFKFAPVLGSLIADAVDGHVISRFRWRSGEPRSGGEERSRHA